MPTIETTPLPSVTSTSAPSGAPTAASSPVPLLTDPYAVLARTREVFHAHARPAYVAYNLDRREWINMQPIGDLSYFVRIWCRTSDSAALWRLWNPYRHRAIAGLHFFRPEFNAPVDPGPPTGDIFVLAPEPTPAPHPTGTERLRTIGVVTKSGDLDYRATLANTKHEHGVYHLRLDPLRDRERNWLRELWIDPATFEVQRATGVERLFIRNEGFYVPDRVDLTFELQDGVPVLRFLRASAVIPPMIGGAGWLEEGEYRYSEIVFASWLPDWYFEPKRYRQHFHEAPMR